MLLPGFGFFGYYSGFIIEIVFWFSIVWMYKDLKMWRRKGVSVNPGAIASEVVVSYVVLRFFTSFIFFGFGSILTPVVYWVGYILIRNTTFAKIAREEKPPLPPPSRFSKWLFIVLFCLPILPIVGIILLLLSFRGGSFIN